MQDTKLNRIGNISTLLPMYWGPDIGPVWGKACGKTGSPGHLGQQMRQGKVKSHNHYTQCVRVCGVCARACLCVAGDNCHPEISQPRRWGCAFQGWLRTCLYWLPDCSLSAQLLSTAFSQTLPPQTQGPPLREIRQVVSWRPRVPPIPQGQCDLPPHGKTCRCSCRHLGHSGCTQTSAEKSCLCPIYSSPVPLALLTSPSGLYRAEYRTLFRGATSEKECGHFWDRPTAGDVTEVPKSQPFQLIVSGAPGPATAQQLHSSRKDDRKEGLWEHWGTMERPQPRQ